MWHRRLWVVVLVVVSAAWVACAPLSVNPRATASTTVQGTATAPSTPTAAPTYTAAPSHSLVWQAHQPATSEAPRRGGSFDTPTISFSQVDANLAYECVAPNDGSVKPAAVWITHDGARTWRRVADLDTGDAFASCTIVPDEANPAIAIAETMPYGFSYAFTSPVLGGFDTLATRDEGARWEIITGPYDTVRGLATFRNATYALFARHTLSATPLASELAVSTDGMHTWARIDYYSGAMTAAFWLNPTTGELLTQVNLTGVKQPYPMATSTDGGAHWSALRGPPGDPATYVVQRPIANQPWHACAVYNQPIVGIGNTTPPHLLDCTADSGRTWTTRLGSELYANVIGIANDGSVLKTSNSTPCTVQRLTPSGSTWESLGMTPIVGPHDEGCWGVQYSAGSGNGALWYLPVPSIDDIAPPPTQAQRLIYVASYA